jgi:MtN3 and saliva related transmembrane protein
MSSQIAVMAGTWGVAMGLAPLLQLRTILRRRSSADVSVGYLAVLLVGFVLWLAYGISIGDTPLIITNTVALSASTATFVAVLAYRDRAAPPADTDVTGR